VTSVNVQKIREGNPAATLLPETVDVLSKVQQRAFELFESRGRTPGNDVDDWLQAEREAFRVPDTELAEVDGEFQLELALPGFDAKDIHVAALPDAVIVEGEAAHQHRGASGRVYFCEFGERRVFRRIPLPRPADVDRASATLDNGLLKVRVAKAEQQRARTAA
jgi:HSP20 family molecular chaperone IbpA